MILQAIHWPGIISTETSVLIKEMNPINAMSTNGRIILTIRPTFDKSCRVFRVALKRITAHAHLKKIATTDLRKDSNYN